MSSASMLARRPTSGAESFFQWSLYLLLVMGFAALAGTGKLDFFSFAVVIPALLLRGYQLLRSRTFSIPELWTNYLTIFYVAFYAVDYFLLSQGFVSATVHMVLFIMVIKIFSVQRDRDLLYLAVLSFLMVLAAAVLTVDTLFLLMFGLFLLAAMATFIGMEMRRSEREAATVSIPPPASNRFHRSLSAVAALLAVATLAGSVAIFFIIPRMNARGYLRNLGTQSELVTGFSEGINLGGIGRIQQSNAVVMHVQVLKGALPPDVKWRGVALTNFDGRRWSNHHSPVVIFRGLHNSSVDLSQFAMNGPPLFSGPGGVRRRSTLTYRVRMEPVGITVFFLAPIPLTMMGIDGDVAVNEGGSVFVNDETSPGRYLNGQWVEGPKEDTGSAPAVGLYYGESDTTDPTSLVRNSSSGEYPAAISTLYEQLPRLDPRIPALAEQITASATSNYARAKAIETYLRGQFGYTLDLPAGVEADPLAHFLFERKKGHCEYFASSMAILLRTLGLPARVVNGFRGGEYNDLTGSYILRARDAHSWVEAYFPEYGWVTFDPTPSAPADAAADFWSRLPLYADAAREAWREWVVNYDFEHQARLSADIGGKATAAQSRMNLWFWSKYRRVLRRARHLSGPGLGFSTRKILLLCALLPLLAALPFAPRAWRSWRRTRILRNPQRAPKTAASFWYSRMLKSMEHRGIHKSPAQTPSEFASGIADPGMRGNVTLFTKHYQRARFAGSAEDARLLPELYEELAEK